MVAAEVAVSWRRILVLFVLVAALGAYLYFYEVPQAQKEGKKDKLIAVDKDAVTGVALTYPDRAIELTKKDTGWRITKPVDAPADETVVKSLVATIADAEVQKSLDDLPADLAPFGLDKPTVTARLTLKDGTEPPAVAVGKNTALGGKTYVRKGDEPKLYLTTTAFSFGLNKQVKDLREKKLLSFQDDDARRIELVPQSGETIAVVRGEGDAKDTWTIMPGGHTADPTEVRSYLSSLRSTSAVDFPDDAPTDLAKYGLDRPRLTVRVMTGQEGGNAATLLLGGETTQAGQKQVYAKRGEQATVYALGEFSYNTLNKTAAQLRDKTILPVDPSQVGRIVIERRDGGGVTLVQSDTGWKIEGVDKPLKADAVTRFVDDLRELRGADIVAEPAKDLGAWGLAAPDLRVSVSNRDGQAVGTIVAAKRDTKRYVMRAGTETVFEARDYMYARLDKQQLDFEAEDPKAAGSATTLSAPPEPPALEYLGEDDGGADLGDEESTD